jgi:anti-sigma regulatory factor (Ser/Thr protein kinase)
LEERHDKRDILDRFRLQVSSDPVHVKPVRDFVYRMAVNFGFSSRRAFDLKLITGEALRNIILHAYEGQKNQSIFIEGLLLGNHMEISFRDFGKQLPISSGNAADLSEYRESGIGVYLISRLSDYHYYNQSLEKGTKLTVKLRRD